jgi:peptidoglycan/xylan/chitin deacetylase (PgdA/CDA1 family)
MVKNSKVTIVMYHYIREFQYSRFPNIKGLDLSQFVEQIEYLKKNYCIIRMEELIEAIDNHSELPPKAVVLTFDDAYIDHYLNVFPILDKNKLQGSFFPPVKAITEHQVLCVNKIHHILAAVDNKQLIIDDINKQLDSYRKDYELHENDYYFKKLAIANRFDEKEIIFIKRLLQVELVEELRNAITNALFYKYVSNDESAFSRELYMNKEQIACMRRNGMHIGNHGYDHYWLTSLPKEKQEYEIDQSLEFIRNIGGDLNAWTMCYPFGNYNDDTISILRERGCKLGLISQFDVADISTNNRFELPRLDTNDIPKHRNADVNDWYYKA